MSSSEYKVTNMVYTNVYSFCNNNYLEGNSISTVIFIRQADFTKSDFQLKDDRLH